MNLSKPLEIVEDKGTWYAAVHGVTKSWTQLVIEQKQQQSKILFKNYYSTQIVCESAKERVFFLPFLYNYPCGFIRLFSSAVST